MWLGVVSRTDTKKDTYLEEIELCAQNLTTSLGSIVKNMIGGTEVNYAAACVVQTENPLAKSGRQGKGKRVVVIVTQRHLLPLLEEQSHQL